MQESVVSDFAAKGLYKPNSEEIVKKESLEEGNLAVVRSQSAQPQPPKDINLLPMKFGAFATTATRIEFFCHLDEYLIESKIRSTLLTDTVGFQFLVPGERLDEEDPESAKPCLVYVEMHNVAESSLSIVRFRCASGNIMAFAQFYTRVYSSVLKNYEDIAF